MTVELLVIMLIGLILVAGGAVWFAKRGTVYDPQYRALVAVDVVFIYFCASIAYLLVWG